ncbi:hypothetical protein [Pengzhenrongella sicca]|uniref:Uncharacterized protein n=1 Tax=Pengzhenrongella sicca TaxID=2819238 RepID=A0A8A4ZFJ4_9MICO|nr:hypothetical protein [Pengzhenrongella sicca]QTE30065.1 hypothetical protein J4E96_03310 [Pengzhenrongella sicca]
MTMTWNAPAAVLTGYARDWDGVWMLVYAAGHAAMSLAAVPGADGDLGLTYASLDTSYALTEIEQHLVDFTNTGVTVDLGPVDLAHRDAAVQVIDDLLAAAATLTARLSAEPDVGAADVLCATRVAILVASARAKATGGAW